MPTQEEMFRKVSDKEYQILIDGKYQSIFVPYGKVSLIFNAFISNGGVVDAATGQITTDLGTLMSSFQVIGNLLLTEYDDTGKVVKEGSCYNLEPKEVIALFQLASKVIESFIVQLTTMNPQG